MPKKKDIFKIIEPKELGVIDASHISFFPFKNKELEPPEKRKKKKIKPDKIFEDLKKHYKTKVSTKK